jgi:hypothetical protein
MNIGTMGAATILMGNASRMGSRYGGGGGGNSEQDPQPEKKGFFRVWGLLIFNILTFSIGVTILVLEARQSDYFYQDLKSTVIEKKIFQREGSKGKVYDEGYLRLEYESGIKKWTDVSMITYLNTETGSRFTQRVERPDVPVGLFVKLSFGFMLLWCVGASASIVKSLES